ncbi:hypothetical protein Leryth_019757 [Lithospermum erythrorhizon]|nr:hypothetical protein Leryth_019757 [Lithospermum erythrorhizon]
MEVNNGFCTDEVPLIQPNEILVTNFGPTTTNSSTSPCSSSSSSNNNNLFEDMQFLENLDQWQPELDYIIPMGTLWDDDEFVSNLDLFLNNTNSDENVRNNVIDAAESHALPQELFQDIHRRVQDPTSSLLLYCTFPDDRLYAFLVLQRVDLSYHCDRDFLQELDFIIIVPGRNG